METTAKNVKGIRIKHAVKWFQSRVGNNIFRRVYNSITGKCYRQYIKIENQSHALSLYLSQNNGFRYDEN